MNIMYLNYLKNILLQYIHKRKTDNGIDKRLIPILYYYGK